MTSVELRSTVDSHRLRAWAALLALLLSFLFFPSPLLLLPPSLHAAGHGMADLLAMNRGNSVLIPPAPTNASHALLLTASPPPPPSPPEDDPERQKLRTLSAPPPEWTFWRRHLSISSIPSASTKSVTLSSRSSEAERASKTFSRYSQSTSTSGSDLRYAAMARRRTSIPSTVPALPSSPPSPLFGLAGSSDPPPPPSPSSSNTDAYFGSLASLGPWTA
mmetsp:Transcript_29664/g.70504  ORF Transcript_29664/g.70504 Transcript_29664/m.70504 type:complete len:219 (-) Transcript_29664:768-1424(-)